MTHGSDSSADDGKPQRSYAYVADVPVAGSYTYTEDVLVADVLARFPGVERIWANGKLVWEATPAAPAPGHLPRLGS